MSGCAAVFTLVGALAVTACGDDANDHARRTGATVATVAVAADTPASVPTPGSSNSPRIEIGPTGEEVSVIALDNTFRPNQVDITVGGEVRWQNRGLNDHDVLSIRGDDWGVDVDGFGPGSEYTHVFDSPGEYRYFCSIHGTQTFGMIGTIVVKPVSR